MAAPRLEIDLRKIRHNALTLVERLGTRGISVTGVTKATLGSAEIATTLLEAGLNDWATRASKILKGCVSRKCLQQ